MDDVLRRTESLELQCRAGKAAIPRIGAGRVLLESPAH